MTNLEFIQSMDSQTLAELLYNLIHTATTNAAKQLAEKYDIDVTVINIDPEMQIEVHRKWLEREREEG